MIAEVALVCLAIVACYAMRLRAVYVAQKHAETLAAAWTAKADAEAKSEELRAHVRKLAEDVRALQGARNADVFGARNRV